MSFGTKVFSVFQRDLLLFVTNLITGVVVARTLGPAALGAWIVMALVPAYAEAFGRLKVEVACVHFIGKKAITEEEALRAINLIALVMGGLLFGVLLLNLDGLHRLLFPGGDATYRAHLGVLLCQIPLQFLYLNYSYIHLAREDVAVYNRMIIVSAWMNSTVAVGLLVLTDLQLWAVIIAAVMAPASALAYGWVKVDRSGWRRGPWDFDELKQLVRYGSNFYLAGVLAHVQEVGTRTLSVAFLAPAQIAFLGQGQNIGRLLQRVPDALNVILFPRVSASFEDSAVRISCKAFRVSAVLMVPSAIMLAVFAEPLITTLYGEVFRTTAGVVHIVLPGLVIGGVGSTLGAYFTGSGRANLIPRIQVLPLLVQLGLTWILTDRYGLSGAASALSIGLALQGIAILLVFLRVSGARPGQLFPEMGDLQRVLHVVRPPR
jgi:O-antigen/teichoic acid export membrane protein